MAGDDKSDVIDWEAEGVRMGYQQAIEPILTRIDEIFTFDQRELTDETYEDLQRLYRRLLHHQALHNRIVHDRLQFVAEQLQNAVDAIRSTGATYIFKLPAMDEVAPGEDTFTRRKDTE